MRLKELFIRDYLIIIILLTILVILSVFMYRNNNALIKSNEIRYKSIVIADELRRSSDELTTYCRTYVETDDKVWKEKYFELLDIRNGKKRRVDGALISLQDSIKKLGVTNAELNKLKEAEQNSNNLVKIERVSINIADGLYDDNSNHLSVSGNQDLLKARRFLYDEKYFQSKHSIMMPIDQYIKMVKARTELEVKKDTTATQLLLFLIIALIVIMSLFVLVSFRTINKKISGQFDELQKAKTEAEQNEEKFNIMLQESPDMIIITTLEGDLVDCNPAALKFHGAHSKEELKDVKTAQIFVNQNEQTAIADELRKNEIVRNKEAKLKSITENLTIDCLVSSNLIKLKGNKPLIISWIRDISEKIITEETILKLSAAVSQNPAAIVITDLSGKIEYANQQFSKITGYSNREAIGINPRILKSGHHPKEFYTEMWNTILSKRTWVGEIYNKRKDGSFFWEAATIAPILNNKNEIINIVAIKQDITDKKIAELALVESQKKLEELNDTKNQLFSIIGHDLRGPIGTLKSFIELVIEKPDCFDVQDIKQSLQLLLSSTTTTYELLENLLLWAKSQQNEVVFLPENIDLHQIIEKNMALVSEMAKNKDITIHNLISDKQIIFADRNMIMTVIRNLITNAIKFTENGKNIYLSLAEDKVSFTIIVKDEGLGIAADVLKRLFIAKENNITLGTLGEKGSGLGLILCKDFIEKHNGKIWVESEVGKCSEFKFTIPKSIK